MYWNTESSKRDMETIETNLLYCKIVIPLHEISSQIQKTDV